MGDFRRGWKTAQTGWGNFSGRAFLVFLFLLLPSMSQVFASDVPDLGSLFLPSGSLLSPGQWRYDEATGRSIVLDAQRSFLKLSSYRCLVRTFYHEESDGRPLKADEKLILSVRFPGDIRIDLLRPRNGAWLVSRKDKNDVLIKPFSFLPMTVSLSPDSSLITSRFGHTINHSDYASFYSRVLAPSCLLGGCVYLDRGVVLGHEVFVVNVAPVFGVARPVFGRMWVSFDKKTHLPVSISTMDSHGHFMERITYTHCQNNLSFPQNFFNE